MSLTSYRHWDGLYKDLARASVQILGDPPYSAGVCKNSFLASGSDIAIARQHVFEIDARSRKRIDTAARHFSRRGDWPRLRADERCVLSLRLKLASRICLSVRGLSDRKQRTWF